MGRLCELPAPIPSSLLPLPLAQHGGVGGVSLSLTHYCGCACVSPRSNSQGGIWRSANKPKARSGQKKQVRKLASRDGKRPGAPRQPFIAAENFAGRRDGYCYKAGPSGTGYYLDGETNAPANAAPVVAQPTQVQDADRTSSPRADRIVARSTGQEHDLQPSPPSTAERRLAAEYSDASLMPPPPIATNTEQRLGDQDFDIGSAFGANNFSSSLFPDDGENEALEDAAHCPSPTRAEPIMFFNDAQQQDDAASDHLLRVSTDDRRRPSPDEGAGCSPPPCRFADANNLAILQGVGGAGTFDEAESRASFLEALGEWRGAPVEVEAKAKSKPPPVPAGAIPIKAPGAQPTRVTLRAPVQALSVAREALMLGWVQ